MMGRRDRGNDWIWEEVAALKRDRPEPDTPAGEGEVAETTRLLQRALDVPVDSERQVLSRLRLLDAIRAEPALQMPAPSKPERSLVGTLLGIVLPLAAAVLLGFAGWHLNDNPEWLVCPRAPRQAERHSIWESKFYLGSVRILRSDRALRDEFGGPAGLLRPGN